MHLKPMFKWAGSKQDEIPLFVHAFPKAFDHYLEPFCGGASVFFHINKAASTICDNNVELINLYQQISTGHAKQVVEGCNAIGLTEKAYYHTRDEFVPKTDVDRAIKYFYILKTCYRGMTRYNKKGKFNIPWGRYKTIDFSGIMSVPHETLLKHSAVVLGDYSVVLDRAKTGDFAFFDPPYDSEFKNYFISFGKEEHKKLAERFIESKCYSMMVIAETDLISSLYKEQILSKYGKSYKFRITKDRIKSNDLNVNHLIIVNDALRNHLNEQPSFFEE